MRNWPVACLVAAWAAAALVGEAFAQTPEQARALIEQGRIAHAHAALEAWLTRVPDDPLALVLLASIEFDGARSQEYYRKAQQADPQGQTTPTCMLGIANYYFARGFYNTAQRLARQALERTVDSSSAPWAELLVGRCLLATGQDAEAAGEVRPLMSSPQPEVRIAAAGVWAEATLADGRPTEVIRALSREGWASYPYELSSLAEAYRANGDRAKARDVQWRATLARRAWKNDSLRHVAPEAASRAAPVPVPATSPEPPRVQGPAGRGTPAPPSGPAPPEQPAATPVASGASAGAQQTADQNSFRGGPKGYSLQVGAFGNEGNAVRLREKLLAGGYEVIIRRTGSLHRVWVGNYASLDAARAEAPALKQATGLEPAIVRNR